MAYQAQFADTDEQIHDTDFEVLANLAWYNVESGCGATDSLTNLDITVASGVVHINNATVAVTGDDVTLVPDSSNPRYVIGWADDTGAVGVTHGTAAASPQKPELNADEVMLFVRKLQPGLTIANNATLKLDKRIPAPAGGLDIGAAWFHVG